MKISKGEKIFQVINVIFLVILSLAIIYPVVYTLSASFSSKDAVVTGKVFLWPVDFDLAAYKHIFSDKTIWVAYLNSIFYTAIGTVMSLVLTICGAYPLSKPRLRGRNWLTFCIAFTLWFSAGMIPAYLNFRDLGLLNSRFAILLHGTISTYNFVLMKNFFQSIPMSLEEAAHIDGANDLQILFKVYIPLSLPSIATIALFYAVARWNEYLWPMILVQKDALLPLQVVLKKMIVDLNVDLTKGVDVETKLSEETFIYATIVVSSIPMLILYPFIQKYFVKGVMVGSIKG